MTNINDKEKCEVLIDEFHEFFSTNLEDFPTNKKEDRKVKINTQFMVFSQLCLFSTKSSKPSFLSS